MAKITKEKLMNINSKCSNGFKLDLMYYLAYKEYALDKYVQIDGDRYVHYRLVYRDNWTQKQSAYGCTYPVHDGTKKVVLNVNSCLHQNGFMVSNGLGVDYVLESGLTRETIKGLQEWSSKVDDDFISKLEGMKNVL